MRSICYCGLRYGIQECKKIYVGFLSTMLEHIMCNKLDFLSFERKKGYCEKMNEGSDLLQY